MDNNSRADPNEAHDGDELISRRDQLVGLARYVAAHQQSPRYFGWVGNRNLGDEAMYQAVRAYFRPLDVAWKPSPVPTALGRRLVDRRSLKCSLLGGGTLIGGLGWEQFAQDLEQTHCGFGFGTGVRNPVFWDYHPSHTASLEDWVEVLRKLSFLGVRGPDSASLLMPYGLEAEVIGDPACFFAQPSSNWNPRPKTVGFNVGTSQGLMWGGETEPISRVGQFAKGLHDRGWELEFFVVWPKDLAPTLDLIRDCRIPGARVHTIYRSPATYLRLVRRMRAFVGIKLHSVILAMCAGVPSLMLEYRPKCLDFMRSIDMEHLNLRTDRLTPTLLSDQFERALDEGPLISALVADRLAHFRSLQGMRARQLTQNVAGTGG